MEREIALRAIEKPYIMEDEKVISLCIKRLGLTREEFEEFMKLPLKNFWDYPNSFKLMKSFKIPIWILAQMGFITKVAYEKYFGLSFK